MRYFVLWFQVLFCVQAAEAAVGFSAAEFAQEQERGQKVILHFHADWCSTCKLQQKVMDQLEKTGKTAGVKIYTVDYDRELELKKKLRITQQSVLVAFYGAVETARISGQTREKELLSFVNDLQNLTLSDQLRMMKEAASVRLPADKLKIMADSTQKLKESEIEARALKIGQSMPNFTLPTADNKTFDLKTQLKKGPVVILFYRGSWCPYCNAELSAYQNYLEKFRKSNTTLVAITPEKPDLAVLTLEKKKLEFPILSDEKNTLAKRLGLVFPLPEELKKLYSSFGIDLEKSQGSKDWSLPVPAAYVVAPSGKITYAFVDADYTRRANPADVLAAVEKIPR